MGQNIVFSHSEMILVLIFFAVCYVCYSIYFVITNLCTNCFLLLMIINWLFIYFFHKNILIFSCSGMFRNVQCSVVLPTAILSFDFADMDFPALTSLVFLALTHFLGKYISKNIIVSKSPSSSFIKLLVETKLKLSYQSFANSLTANSTGWACLPIQLTKEKAISR